jgi:hypothetical protein
MRAKTGGRKRGTPNRKTGELVERLETLDCDPLAALVAVAADPTTPLEIRVSINKELLAYVFPKRKSIDVEHTGPPVITLHFGAEDALL